MKAFAVALLGAGLLAAPAPVDRIDALFEAVDRSVTKLGRPVGGAAELAKTTAGDLDKVRAVLSKIAFEPYAGVLKGAEGAWATGAANSFDRALLAKTLLGPGRRVRFAIGMLPPGKARELFLAAPRAAVGKPEGKRAAVWADVDAAVASLLPLLAAKGIVPGGAAEPPPDPEWCGLEIEQDGGWTALEAMPCAVERRLDDLPAASFHRIEVFARLERSTAGKLETEEILRVEYPAADLVGRPLTFQVVPAPGEASPLATAVVKGGVRAAPGELLKDVGKFVPSVRLGRTGQYGKPFGLDGRTYALDAAKGFALAGAEAVGGRVGGLLGGGRRPAAGSLTAVTWGLRRRSPGGGEEAWERDVLARGEDVAGRARLAFLGSHEVRVHVGGIGLAEGLIRTRRALEPWRGFLKGMRDHLAGKRPLADALRAFDNERPAFTTFEVLRRGFVRDLEERAGVRVYMPTAGLAILHSEFRPVDGDRYVLRESFDIVDMPSAFVGPTPARARLALGVLDTELELRTCACKPAMYNTASMIRRAKPELKVLTRPEEADALPYKASAKARVKADLEKGRAVVAPASEIDGEATWWRIDPASGAALGIGENGYGQTATEYWLTVYDRLKDAYTIGEALYCYLTTIWTNPPRWSEPQGVIAGTNLMGGLLKCIPVCDGVKTMLDWSFADEVEANLLGVSITDEIKVPLGGTDLCDVARDRAVDALFGN